VNRPKVLLLDEPTIGLDPASRKEVIDRVKEMNRAFNMTILLTTHDMAEADELCDRLAIMDGGRIAIIDTPSDLKSSVGGDIVTVGLTSPAAPVALPPEFGSVISREENEIKILTEKGEEKIPRLVDAFEKMGLTIASIALAKPTLDDAFLKYTKHRPIDGGSYAQNRSERRSFVRHSR
jgi:ABC-2 type transport system ATP-binding protein